MDGDGIFVEITKQYPWAGLLLAGVILLLWWRKEVRNPEKSEERAASASVLSGMTDTTSEAVALAQKAIQQASEAYDEAMSAKRGNLRCEQRVTGLVLYTRRLQTQVVRLGGIPEDPPPGLLD